LPTIRSRLPIKVLDVPRDRVVAGLNFKTLDVGEIYKFIKERTPQNKDETKALLQAIMTEALAQGVRLGESELEQFRRLLHLAELNSRAQNILLAALLTIINRREKQPK
jgi:DNA polymerase-3 subunit delta'